MKAAKVDQDLCIGCGLCCGICDKVFRMNEQGTAEAYQPSTDENQDAVQEAIDSCPVSAIVWEDYKKHIYMLFVIKNNYIISNFNSF